MCWRWLLYWINIWLCSLQLFFVGNLISLKLNYAKEGQGLQLWNIRLYGLLLLTNFVVVVIHLWILLYWNGFCCSLLQENVPLGFPSRGDPGYCQKEALYRWYLHHCCRRGSVHCLSSKGKRGFGQKKVKVKFPITYAVWRWNILIEIYSNYQFSFRNCGNNFWKSILQWSYWCPCIDFLI